MDVLKSTICTNLAAVPKRKTAKFSKNLCITLLILITCGSPTIAQDVVLDLQGIQRQRTADERVGKPDWAASGLNLLLPGVGHFYLGERAVGTAFLTTDIVLLTSFFFTRFSSNRRFDSSIGFARIHAHTQSRRSSGDRYWSFLANRNFMDVHELNWAFANNRDFDMQFLDAADFFSWDSEESRDRFAQMRRSAESWRTASTLMLGALALNRMVSFVSARVATRRYNDRLLSVPVITATADLQNNSVGANFHFTFR